MNINNNGGVIECTLKFQVKPCMNSSKSPYLKDPRRYIHDFVSSAVSIMQGH